MEIKKISPAFLRNQQQKSKVAVMIKTLNGCVSASQPHYSTLTNNSNKVVSVTYTKDNSDGWGVTKEVSTLEVIDLEFALKMESECGVFL